MLEDARKKGASIFVYLIFCLLIVIFVINFGPQGGQGGGCDNGNSRIAIGGEDASNSAWLVAYSANNQAGDQKTYAALELLIRQELLAQAAEERGLRVTEDLVMDQIKKGRFFLGGQTGQIPGIFTEDGFWNQNAFNGWVGQLRVSRNSYIEEQERALLASMMSELLQSSVQVSRDEALEHYKFENDTAQYDVVAFRPEAYRAAMKLTDADVERFLTTHAAEVEARYKADERTYKGVKPQLQLREIFIATAEPPKPEQPPAPAPDGAAGSAATSAAGSAAASAAGSAAGSAAPATKPATAKADKAVADKTGAKPDAKAPAKEPTTEQAKAKLEAVRTAAAKNAQKFVDAAKTLNTDETLKNSAGDLGWRSAENAMLGEKAVTDAVKTLKPGEMTPVITTDRGAYLIRAEATREGDLSFDQVKHEIAKQLAKDVWSKEAAKRAALAALDKARAGTGLNLDQLYDKEQTAPNPGVDIEQIINNPNLTPEQKQQILEMLMKQNGQQGSITVESDDVPASWAAQADGAGGGSATTPAAPASKPAAPASKPAAPASKPAAPASKPATGSASPAKPAATDGAKATGAKATAAKATDAKASDAKATDAKATDAKATDAAAPAAGATPAATEIKASDDTLPAFGEIEKPTVARFGPAPRTPTMSGIGSSKPAAAALFEDLTPGMLGKQVYEGDGAFVVIQLISRSQPTVDDFKKDADRIMQELRAERGAQLVEHWLKDRCESLAKDGKIQPNVALLRQTDDKGNPVPTQYRPCMSFR